MKRRLFDSGVALCTVGGAIFAVGVSKEPLSKIISLPQHAYGLLTVVGGALAAVGGVAFLLSFFVEPLETGWIRVVYGDTESTYICLFAGPSDLQALHDLYAAKFGEEVPSADLMKSWLTRYPKSFAVIYRCTQSAGMRTGQELVGSFKVIPLSATGVRALDLGQVTGSTFRSAHICSTRGRPVAYYVGDVVGTTRFGRAVVMAHLSAACSRIAITAPIYARPLTIDGRRIMTKHGFVQVSDGRSAPEIGRVCKLELRGTMNARTASRTGRQRLVPLA